MNLPADAPGRKAYAEFLDSWQGDDAKARDLAFLRVIAREYFRVMGEANQEHDPDHLIFGDRFAFNTIVPEVLEELVPWVDAIAIQPPFQPGFPKAKYQEIHELTGKPILICDFAIRFKDGDKSIRGWQLQEDAARRRSSLCEVHPRRTEDALHHRRLLVQSRRLDGCLQ